MVWKNFDNSVFLIPDLKTMKATWSLWGRALFYLRPASLNSICRLVTTSGLITWICNVRFGTGRAIFRVVEIVWLLAHSKLKSLVGRTWSSFTINLHSWYFMSNFGVITWIRRVWFISPISVKITMKLGSVSDALIQHWSGNGLEDDRARYLAHAVYNHIPDAGYCPPLG